MRLGTTAFVMLFFLLIAAAPAAAQDLSKKTVAELVTALDSDSAAQRDAAQQELIRRGAAVVEPLQKILDNNPPPEVKVRAEQIIARAFVPTAGRGYWPTSDEKKQKSLQPGDVIFEADGLPIRTRYDLFFALDNDAASFKVHRKGEGVRELAELTNNGCWIYPGPYEWVLDTGEEPDPALLKTLNAFGRDNSKELREALDPLVKDLPSSHPVVAYMILMDLWVSGVLANSAEAKNHLATIESLRSATFQGGTDFWSLPRTPYMAFVCLMNLGERDKAMHLFAEARQRAAKSDDPAVRAAMAAWQMEVHLASSPLAEARKFWDANAPAMHEACGFTLSDPLGDLARRIAAEEGFDAALTFVRAQPKRWVQKTLADYYEQQSRLAAKADLDKPIRWVQVDSLAPRRQAVATNFYRDDDLLNVRPTARIEMTMQTSRVNEPGNYIRNIDLRLTSERGVYCLLDLEGAGQFRSRPNPRVMSSHLPTPPYHTITANHRVALELRKGGVKVEINGMPFQQTCFDLPKEGILFAHTSGLASEIRDIRVLVPAGTLSEEQVAEVAEAWAALDKAFAQAAPDKAKQAADTLKQLLAGAMSKETQARLDARVWLLRGLCTPEGASLLDKRALSLTTGRHWVVRGQTLVLESQGKAAAAHTWPTSMRNMELSGLFEITGTNPFVLRMNFSDGEEYVWFRPGDSAAGLHKTPFYIAKEQPTSFVLRVRDTKAALFVNNGDKPAATIDLTEPAASLITFRAQTRNEKDTVKFLQLRLR